MPYTDYTQELIGLKDVVVTSVERKENSLHLHIKMNKRAHDSPRCKRSTNKVHDYRTQRVKDVSSFGNYTILHLRKRRYVCPYCNMRFYEETSFLPRYHRLASRLIDTY